MASLNLNNITKIYKGNVKAVSDFSMDIKDGEFIVFVGPSGCGKSTTLRMIAGLEDITSGELYIDGKYMNDVEPKDRDLAMVFQNYALYPYLTVYENIAFGLRMRKIKVFDKDSNGNPIYIVDQARIKEINKEIKELDKTYKKADEEKKAEISQKINDLKTEKAKLETNPSLEKYHLRKFTNAEIDEKVQHVATMLGIKEFLNRKPGALSGGQRQRVALGRAIVRDARVYLFDEPLSNLDAKLRAAMRVEITNLHHKLNTTFIYVTHDQVEAMTMGTRIVVMKEGYVQQIDTPTNLYDYPANKFVAGFIGTPPMNFFSVNVLKKRTRYEVSFSENVSVDIGKLDLKEEYLQEKEFKAILGVRSEDIHLADENEKGFEARVKIVETLGSECLVYMQLDNDNENFITNKEFVMKVQGRCSFMNGDVIKIALNNEHIHLFDNNTENSVLIKK